MHCIVETVKSGMAPSLVHFLLPLLLFPSLITSQDAYIASRATFYGSPDCSGTPSGACGYGEFGRNLNDGHVGAVSRLYRNGTGCGACYQVRCTCQQQLCSQDGLTIVVTDHGEGDNTDFILSSRGFAKLALPNMATQLMAYGVVDVQYRRVSCQYPGNNMVIKITQHSRFPDYIALIIIYQAGHKDILDVQLWQEDCKEWKGMRKAYGAVWDMVYPPKGPINVRLLTAAEGGSEQQLIQLTGTVPENWQAGVSYDTATQLA